MTSALTLQLILQKVISLSAFSYINERRLDKGLRSTDFVYILLTLIALRWRREKGDKAEIKRDEKAET